MSRLVLLLIACAALGCGSAQVPDVAKPKSSMLVNIQSIVAEQLGLKAVDVRPELTFAAVGADDLDLVEITMEVEDRFGIAIRDDSLLNAAGAKDATSLCDQMTIRTFASVAESAPKQPHGRPLTSSSAKYDAATLTGTARK